MNNLKWETNYQNEIILMDIILENFKKYGNKKQYKFLKKNSKNISKQLFNLSNFFNNLNILLNSNKNKKDIINILTNIKDKKNRNILDKKIATKIIYSFENNELIGGNIPYKDAYNSYIYDQYNNFKKKNQKN